MEVHQVHAYALGPAETPFPVGAGCTGGFDLPVATGCGLVGCLSKPKRAVGGVSVRCSSSVSSSIVSTSNLF